jgi:hypothetical protein
MYPDKSLFHDGTLIEIKSIVVCLSLILDKGFLFETNEVEIKKHAGCKTVYGFNQ